MKTAFTLLLSFLSFSTILAQQSNGANGKKQYTGVEVKLADPSQIITTTDPAFLKIKNTEVKQADPTQIVTTTDPAFLKIKNTEVRQADPSQIVTVTDPAFLKSKKITK